MEHHTLFVIDHHSAISLPERRNVKINQIYSGYYLENLFINASERREIVNYLFAKRKIPREVQDHADGDGCDFEIYEILIQPYQSLEGELEPLRGNFYFTQWIGDLEGKIFTEIQNSVGDDDAFDFIPSLIEDYQQIVKQPDGGFIKRYNNFINILRYNEKLKNPNADEDDYQELGLTLL